MQPGEYKQIEFNVEKSEKTFLGQNGFSVTTENAYITRVQSFLSTNKIIVGIKNTSDSTNRTTVRAQALYQNK